MASEAHKHFQGRGYEVHAHQEISDRVNFDGVLDTLLAGVRNREIVAFALVPEVDAEGIDDRGFETYTFYIKRNE